MSGYADGHKIIKECQHRGAEIRRGKGDHVIIRGQGGSVVVPDREIGKGLACKILKQLAKIGLLLCFIAFAIACIGGV